LVNDFVFPYKAEIFPGETFKISAIRLQRLDFPFQLFIFGAYKRRMLLEVLFFLIEVKNTQETPLTKNGEGEKKQDKTRWDEIHPLLHMSRGATLPLPVR